MSEKPLNILLVEDNPDDALLIEAALAESQNGRFSLRRASRLTEGLETLSQGNVDVLLLDLSLPDSHGPETFTKARSGSPDIPIIVLTGLDDETVASQAVRQGAQDYLVKNQVDSPLLSRSIRYALERHSLLADLVGYTRELSRINTELESEVAERKRAEDELAEKAEELSRSNTELEQFAYVASHDLQEPLRMVSSFVEILAKDYEEKFDEQAEKYMGFVLDGARRMKALIDDLLSFSRVGTRELIRGPINCDDVVRMVISDLRAIIDDNKAAVTHDPLPTVLADPTQMTQLFQNLISNGIKFRGEHSPHIHVSAEERGEEWVLSVQDDGIGIEPRHFDRIFLMFQRLHQRSEYPGTGIGLAMCKKIVENHGGKIWLESEVGKGSTFYFGLPKKPPPSDSVPPNPIAG